MFTLIFNQLLKMLIIMLLAYFCYKIGLITQEGNRTLSNLLLMVVNPCLIITVYQTPYDPTLIHGLMISFAAAAAAHILGIFLAHFLIPAGKSPEYAIERIAAVYSNCGFIGIPLINSVLGSDGVFYLTAYMTVFNILTWTHSRQFFVQTFAPGSTLPYDDRSRDRCSPLLYQNPASFRPAGFHELYCRYEHAAGYDHCRRIGRPNGFEKNLYQAAGLLDYVFKTDPHSGCNASAFGFFPGRSRCRLYDADRGSLSDRSYFNNDGDPV